MEEQNYIRSIQGIIPEFEALENIYNNRLVELDQYFRNCRNRLEKKVEETNTDLMRSVIMYYNGFSAAFKQYNFKLKEEIEEVETKSKDIEDEKLKLLYIEKEMRDLRLEDFVRRDFLLSDFHLFGLTLDQLEDKLKQACEPFLTNQLNSNLNSLPQHHSEENSPGMYISDDSFRNSDENSPRRPLTPLSNTELSSNSTTPQSNTELPSISIIPQSITGLSSSLDILYDDELSSQFAL